MRHVTPSPSGTVVPEPASTVPPPDSGVQTVVLGPALRRIEPSALTPDATNVFVRGARHLYVLFAGGLRATVVWGAIGEHEARALGEMWAATLPGAPHRSLLDVTGVVHVDERAFEAMHRFLDGQKDARGSAVERQALVCQKNLGGTIIRGYFAVHQPPYPVEVFETRGAALASLDKSEHEATIERLVPTGDESVAAMQAILDQEPLGELTLPIVARRLALTPRTLQRRLAGANLRFTEELARAQVARAQRLMLQTDKKLGEIAFDVGCASLSTFSELFRRVVGEPPRNWRARHRPG